MDREGLGPQFKNKNEVLVLFLGFTIDNFPKKGHEVTDYGTQFSYKNEFTQ